MARKRLTWNRGRQAGRRQNRRAMNWYERLAGPNSMNQEREHVPTEHYMTGDPSSWAEDPVRDLSHMGGTDRDIIGLPEFEDNTFTHKGEDVWGPKGTMPYANEHTFGGEDGGRVRAAKARLRGMQRHFEKKALQCVKIAEALLPEADEDTIAEQALDLMSLSDETIIETSLRLESNGKYAEDEEKDVEEMLEEMEAEEEAKEARRVARRLRRLLAEAEEVAEEAEEEDSEEEAKEARRIARRLRRLLAEAEEKAEEAKEEEDEKKGEEDEKEDSEEEAKEARRVARRLRRLLAEAEEVAEEAEEEDSEEEAKEARRVARRLRRLLAEAEEKAEEAKEEEDEKKGEEDEKEAGRSARLRRLLAEAEEAEEEDSEEEAKEEGTKEAEIEDVDLGDDDLDAMLAEIDAEIEAEDGDDLGLELEPQLDGFDAEDLLEEEDATLQALLEQEQGFETLAGKQASAKSRKVNQLGRVKEAGAASTRASALEGLWETAPDVSKIFS